MKKLFEVILLFLICGYIYMSYKDFKKESLFSVTNIVINTTNEELFTDLKENIGKLKGRNILELDRRNLEKILQQDIRIKKIKVQKQLPDTLIFDIVGKRSHVYVELNKKIYIADKFGSIFGYMRESDRYNIPLLRISKEEEIIELIDLLKKIPSREKVSQIYKLDKGTAVVFDTGLKIITNSKVPEDRYWIAEKLYEEIKNQDKKWKIEHIDLRFKDYIIKKSEGEK
jgi:cell division septal protein FtsQ